MQQLHRALGRPQVAAGEPEIGIDHADQGQPREVPALGDDLGADHQVDLALGDPAHRLGGGVRARQGVAGHHQDARVGEGGAGLLGDPLHAGADRGQAVLGAAGRAVHRHRLGVAAMMAGELAAGAVLDQPGGAVRALDAVAAGAAQRQGRVAASVEEQHRLLGAVQGAGHRLDQRRRQEAAALGRMVAQVHRRHLRQPRAAMADRQREAPVASGLDVGQGLQARRGGDQHHRRTGQARSHHRHVTGVVGDPVLLLEGGLVLLVDDHQAGDRETAGTAPSGRRPPPGPRRRRPRAR